MGDTNISWTDKVWNCLRGCSVVSAGCKNCYAMTLAARFAGDNPKTGKPLAYKGLAYRNSSGAHWTGKVEFVREHLEDPLKWKEPVRIFVNSMSDLFHEGVEDQWLNDIFGIMALAHWHTFQVLTKRPERMLAYLSKGDHGIIHQFQQIEACGGIGPHRMFRALDIKRRDSIPWQWPLPNVHLGVSVEDQNTFDERWGILQRVPAAVRWLSIEPLLGPIDMQAELYEYLDEWVWPDWAVVGGESGPGHREMPLDAALSVIDQLKNICPVWVKQDSGAKPGQQGRIPNEYWKQEFPKCQL